MAHLKKVKLKSGEISYTIQSKAKDPLTGKYKYLCDTWRKPPEMTEYEAKKENARRMFELDEKVKKQVLGVLATNDSWKLTDYIDDWLKNMKLINTELYTIRHESSVKIIKDYFKQVKLFEITPIMVQDFRDTLLKRKIIHESAKLKDDMIEKLKLFVKSKKIRVKRIEDHIGGLSHGTYEAATRGDKILYDSAVKICDGLGIKFEDYFDKIITCKNYSKLTIKHIMGTLNLILVDAKRKQIIEHNFASNEYLQPLKQQKKEIVVLDDNEAKELKKALDNEPNIRWKTAIYIALLTGMRRGEIAGLEWNDFDFENKTISIKRAVREVSHKGLVTKDTKTASSYRTITMPDTLFKVIEKYKNWYDKRKSVFIDDWKNTDRLFISDEGKLLRPSCYKKWLSKILQKANIKVVTLHSLRHTNITMQLINGVDLRTVAARAGHSRTSTTTDIYSHFLKNSDIHASKVIDSLFAD